MTLRNVIPTRGGVLALLAVAALIISGCSSREESRGTLTVIYSNDLLGEVRSCGCAANDYGGLGRRATFVQAVRDTTGDLLVLDGGDLFGVEINYGVEKADLTLRSMGLMGYHGIVPGETDLAFGADFLVERAQALGLPIVAANLVDARADTLLFPPTVETTLPSGLRVGIVGVMGERLQLPPRASDVRVTSADAAVRQYVDELRPRVDVLVLLAHVSRGKMVRLVNELRELDLVVYGHQGRPMRKLARTGNAYALQVPDEGRYVGLAHAVLGRGPEEPPIYHLTAQAVPLSDYYRDNEAVAKLFRSYDLNIAAKEKTGIPAGVFETRAGVERPFAGSETCKGCHEDIYDQWAGTAHAHAFEILVREGREYDRDCTPCHVTGFYNHGGFESLDLTPGLINVQCESCHGNGYAHSNDPEVATGVDASEACAGCHNSQQTPDFDFEAYWARIDHDGADAGASGGGR